MGTTTVMEKWIQWMEVGGYFDGVLVGLRGRDKWKFKVMGLALRVTI